MVYLVYRKDREGMRASPIMADRVLANPKIKPIWHTVVDEVLGDPTTGILTGESDPALWIKLLAGYDIVFTITWLLLFETVIHAE